MRRAMTLLEVLLATALLSVVVGATLPILTHRSLHPVRGSTHDVDSGSTAIVASNGFSGGSHHGVHEFVWVIERGPSVRWFRRGEVMP